MDGIESQNVVLGRFGIHTERYREPGSFPAAVLVDHGRGIRPKKDTLGCYTFLLQQQRSCWASNDTARSEITGGIMYWAVVHFDRPIRLSDAIACFVGMTRDGLKCPDQTLDLKMTVTATALLLPSGPVSGKPAAGKRCIAVKHGPAIQ